MLTIFMFILDYRYSLVSVNSKLVAVNYSKRIFSCFISNWLRLV